MKTIDPYALMLSPRNLLLPFTPADGIVMLRAVEFFARVSHRSEDAQTPESYDRFLRSVVLTHGDWSVTEHMNVSVEAIVDRGITHEWVRHRIGAYTQESTRFVNYQKRDGEGKFIEPSLEMFGGDENARDVWHETIKMTEQSYMKLIELGVKPQIARSVFPNALSSKIIVTYNLRMWRHFFMMRTSAQAHPQMREVTVPLLREFQMKIPILYEDIIPGEQQIAATGKPR